MSIEHLTIGPELFLQSYNNGLGPMRLAACVSSHWLLLGRIQRNCNRDNFECYNGFEPSNGYCVEICGLAFSDLNQQHLWVPLAGLCSLCFLLHLGLYGDVLLVHCSSKRSLLQLDATFKKGG